MAYLGFVSLGLPDTVIGVAWPAVRETFGRSQGDVSWVFIGVGVTYFISSFLTGKLLGWWGIGSLLAISSALVALSAFGYAAAPLWVLFAGCSVLHGLGSGAIDAGLNHHMARHFPARHMSWLHACYTLGAALGPAVMTGWITSGGSWRGGYFSVGGALAVLAVLFVATRRQWERGNEKSSVEGEPETSGSLGEALRHAAVRWQALIYFFYTGLEMTLGQWSFTVLTEERGVDGKLAGAAVTGYWASLLAGRIVAGFVIERVGIDCWLRFSMATAALGAAGWWLGSHPGVAISGLAVAGFGLAAVYPGLMSRTPERVGGRLAAHAVGLQVSIAIAGAALLPSAAGVIAAAAGVGVIPWVALALAVVVLGLHERLLRTDAEAA